MNWYTANITKKCYNDLWLTMLTD